MSIKKIFKQFYVICLVLMLVVFTVACQDQRSGLDTSVLKVPRGALLDIQRMIEKLTDMTDLRLDKLLAVLEDLQTEQLDIKQRVEKIAVSVSFIEAWLRPDMSIYFGFNQTSLRESGKSKLLRFARILREQGSGLKVELQGSTDSVGSSNYNDQLGFARAKTVREYLINVGKLDPSRITQRSFGEMPKYQLLPNANGKAAARNRRVVLIVKDSSE